MIAREDGQSIESYEAFQAWERANDEAMTARLRLHDVEIEAQKARKVVIELEHDAQAALVAYEATPWNAHFVRSVAEEK